MADDLQTIPGIGPNMAQDLRNLGYFRVSDLKGQDPELMYKRLKLIHGMEIDPSVLYVFLSAVYFESEDDHDPELLNSWIRKDRRLNYLVYVVANASRVKFSQPSSMTRTFSSIRIPP